MEILLLSAGCTLLSVTCGYALWMKVRVLRFQRDMLKIRCWLRKKVAALGGLKDLQYLRTDAFVLDYFVNSAARISLSSVIYEMLEFDIPSKRHEKKDSMIEYMLNYETPLPALAAILQRAEEELSSRYATYILKESLLGWIVSAWVALFPRTIIRDRLRASVSDAIMHHDLHVTG